MSLSAQPCAHSFPCSPALPAPLSTPGMPLPDPWLDLYLPAVRGGSEAAAVRARLVGAEEGAFLAVGSRAMEVLGQPVEARRLAEAAFRRGGAEAMALATFLLPQGESVARLRERAGGPGRRADAACDRIVLALRRGNLDAAREAHRDALGWCPDHREARRWGRMLAGQALEVARRHLHGLRGARTPQELDGAALLPTRQRGWISPERLERRALAPLGEGQAPGCGLGRLQQAGARALYLAAPQVYVWTDGDDPRVELELLADEVVSLAEEGRAEELQIAAMALLTGAEALDREAWADAAALVAALAAGAAGADGLRAVAIEECGRIAARARGRLFGGHEAEEWAAWRGRLEGAEGVMAARAMLESGAGGRAWQICVDALAAGGARAEADRRRRAARLHPELAGVARAAPGLRPMAYRFGETG